MGDKTGEGRACCNLGNAYNSINDFQKAIDYHERDLKISRKIGDRAGEGEACGNLGYAYDNLGDFQKAIDYHERHLKISREEGDRAGEGRAYCNLGKAYDGLGDFQKAIHYHEQDLTISREVGDRSGEGTAYSNLGNAYNSLGDFQKAIQYHEQRLEIAREVGDKAGEGRAYCNFGNAYHGLGDFRKAVDYHERHLKIATEMEDKVQEGKAYGNLGNAYRGLGNFHKAIDYHERNLIITRKVGDRAGEGKVYGNLGNAYHSLGDFQKAIDYHKQHLKITQGLRDRAREGGAYCNLGNAYASLGEVRKAIDYHERHLEIAREVGDRAGEGNAYGNLGNGYHSLGDFQKAIDYHERHLETATEVGDRAGEGRAYSSLGNAYHSLSDFQKAIDYHKRHLKITREVGDRAGEGQAYGNLGNAYDGIADFQKAIEYHERDLKIAREVGDKAREGRAYCSLGNAYDSLGDVQKAIHYYENSVKAFDHIRGKLISNDKWKISLRSTYDDVHSKLWGLLLKQGKVVEALLTADQGRAQALHDLLQLKYGFKGSRSEMERLTATTPDIVNYLPSNTAFIGLNEGEIVFWVNKTGQEIKSERRQIDFPISTYFQSLLEITHEKLGVRVNVNCEDRSLRNSRDEEVSDQRSRRPRPYSSLLETNPLRTFYNVVIDPVKDLLQGDEVVFVPQGPLFLAPYAAFMDPNSKYLCETLRMRLLPSLSSLRLLKNCPADWHSKTGALLVGDPWVQEVRYEGARLPQLKWAEKEVQMIGKILQTAPLIGKQATKDEVLRRISSVALVHIAAHGKMETGEIALAPNTTRSSVNPAREDYLLTMKDVLKAQIRARLVVLSCCHSARGEVKSEGVVGIARAFLGAGARAVLVSLWAIDDEATMEFMKVFYQQLVNGRSASEALNKAMKSMRESVRFNAVKYWAPFVLIGDDITVEFEGTK